MAYVNAPSRLRIKNGASVCSTKTTIASSLSTASPLCLQVGHDRSELWVVEAFAELNVEFHAQPVVDSLEGCQAKRDEPRPEGAVFGVAGVEPGGFGPSRVFDGFVAGLDPVLSQPIQPRQLGDRVASNCDSSRAFFQPQRIIPNCEPQSPR